MKPIRNYNIKTIMPKQVNENLKYDFFDQQNSLLI